jgi:hypothetical protein
MATMTFFALTVTLSEMTWTPPPDCTIRRTGELRTTLRPRSDAILSGMSCEPPWKRHCCAPWRVLKLRSNVPGLVSLPELAM